MDQVAFGAAWEVARQLLTDDPAWRATVESSQNIAKERLSFSAMRVLLTAQMQEMP